MKDETSVTMDSSKIGNEDQNQVTNIVSQIFLPFSSCSDSETRGKISGLTDGGLVFVASLLSEAEYDLC